MSSFGLHAQTDRLLLHTPLMFTVCNSGIQILFEVFEEGTETVLLLVPSKISETWAS